MIDRRQFLKLCTLLGVGGPTLSSLQGCNNDDNNTSTDTGGGDSNTATSQSVIIIGAGAAGMSAGHLLNQQGMDFKILEASSTYGGRMRDDLTFADFRILLGAEWMHGADLVASAQDKLAAIVNDPSVAITTETVGYATDERAGVFTGGELLSILMSDLFGAPSTDRKFVGSSWLEFFEQYILPGVQSRITYDTQIRSIDYQGETVQVQDQNGQLYQADKVIVTVPAKILQNSDITFSPPLPANKTATLQEAVIWGGIRGFFEFSEKFYPTTLFFDDFQLDTGYHLYFDASFGQNSSAKILGMTALGLAGEPYQNLSGDAQRDFILNELDQVFGGMASQTYVKHVMQDWSAEPFIQSAYLQDNAPAGITRTLSESIDQKVFFAGDSYQADNWSQVDVAARAARDTIEEILGRSL